MFLGSIPCDSPNLGGFPRFCRGAVVPWGVFEAREGQGHPGCGAYHPSCKSNLCLSPISNDFLLTPTFFSFLALPASSIFLLPVMKGEALNPILIPFARPPFHQQPRAH